VYRKEYFCIEISMFLCVIIKDYEPNVKEKEK
jgi:hypothetical protein